MHKSRKAAQPLTSLLKAQTQCSVFTAEKITITGEPNLSAEGPVSPVKRVWALCVCVSLPGEMVPSSSHIFRRASDQKRFRVIIVGGLISAHAKDLKHQVHNQILS